MYRYQSKQQEITLGKYPVLTLAQARLKNQEIKTQLAQGIDPKEIARQAKQQQSSNCFDAFAQKWLSHQETHTEQTTIQSGS